PLQCRCQQVAHAARVVSVARFVQRVLSEARSMRLAGCGAIAASILLAACALFAPAGARAADEHSANRCQPDALEQWYCASDPAGSAVVDNLGRIVCAPGACVKQRQRDQSNKEEWQCSSVSGGRVDADPAGGPVCDGGCRAPEATAC